LKERYSDKRPAPNKITSKTLKSSYKGTKMTNDQTGKLGESGTWKWNDVNCAQAHILLAQRMEKRDFGNAPQLNDRIPFVAIEVPQKKGVKMLQGERIEHPEYILEKELKIDYLFYLTNQIMNPAKQFLELIMKPIEVDALFRDFIIIEENRRNGRQSLTKYGITKISDKTSNKTTNKVSDKTSDKITNKVGDKTIKQANDTELDFDIFINKKAKPTNTITSKKLTYMKLPKEEYTNINENLDDAIFDDAILDDENLNKNINININNNIFQEDSDSDSINEIDNEIDIDQEYE